MVFAGDAQANEGQNGGYRCEHRWTTGQESNLLSSMTQKELRGKLGAHGVTHVGNCENSSSAL